LLSVIHTSLEVLESEEGSKPGSFGRQIL